MKKIINGKRYDTETAAEVAYWDSEVGKSSFLWYEETLYRKRGGEFFLHGYGHAASPYAQTDGEGGSDPGEKIVPLTEDEAKAWVEQKLDANTYEALFPIEEEDVASMDGGARLVELRKAADLTRAALSEASGVSVRTLESYEQGMRPLSSASGDILLRISKALGCTVEDLIG